MRNLEWALTIDGGNTWAGRPARVSLHESRHAAERALVAYVIRCGGDADLDEDDMIREYFDDAMEQYCYGIIVEPSPETLSVPDLAPRILTAAEKQTAAVEVWANFRKWWQSDPSKLPGSWEAVCTAIDTMAAMAADPNSTRHKGVSFLDDYCDGFMFVWNVLEPMGVVWEDSAEDAEGVLHGDTECISEVLGIISSVGFTRV